MRRLTTARAGRLVMATVMVTVMASTATVVGAVSGGTGGAGAAAVDGVAAAAVDDVTVSVSDDAPGMMRVSWTRAAGSQLNLVQAYRLSWWEGDSTSGEPLDSVVLDARGRPRTADPLVIPDLDSGEYTVQVDVVRANTGSPGYTRVAVIGSDTVTVTAPDEPLEPCEPGVALCGNVAGSEGFYPEALLVSGGTGSGVYPRDDDRDGVYTFGWSEPDDQWVWDDMNNGSRYMRARLQLVDRMALDAGRWWTAFGDAGRNVTNATEVLVPASSTGRGLNLGTIVMEPGTKVTGELREDSGDGTSAPLEPSDFKALCVDVFEQVDTGTWEVFNSTCSGTGSGFQVDREVPGRWQIAVPPGTYRVLFVDRANYYGVENVLLYNVNYAKQWWRDDGTPGDNVASATDIVVDDSDTVEVIDGVDAALRPAKQLRLDVVDIPAGIDVDQLEGRITVSDEFGNWTGGLMVAGDDGRSMGANVTGLVEGRAYKIFLSFNGGGVDKWWLVGGGTLEDASPIVPADVIEEPWQPDPIAVSVHRSDGRVYGAGEACVAIAPLDGASAPLASSCTEGGGMVRLQRVVPGSYRVVAYQRDTVSGELVGEPVVIQPFAVDLGLPPHPSVPGHVRGLADVSLLEDGARLAGGARSDAAIVVPAATGRVPAGSLRAFAEPAGARLVENQDPDRPAELDTIRPKARVPRDVSSLLSARRHGVTVAKKGSGSGTVSTSPRGVDCGKSCSSSFIGGTRVTFTARAKVGSKFTGWSGACRGKKPTCTVTVRRATSVTAGFAKASPQRLTVERSGTRAGYVESKPKGIRCGETCSATFPASSTVTLKVSTAPGHRFVGWGGACRGTSTTCRVVMSSAMKVTARFEARR